MNNVLMEKWNNKVSPEDIVIHLGDFGFKSIEEIKRIRKRLNGTIVLLLGNHDWRIRENCGFIIVRGNLQIGNLILSHRPLLKEEIPKGLINIHGHIHHKDSFNGINICVEKTNYEPIELMV